MATTYAKETKPTTVYSKESKPQNGYLLKEDAFFLLLETGGRIVLSRGTEYTKEAKP